jgi:hypothetical protein
MEMSLLQTIKPSNCSLTTNSVYAEVVFKAGSFTHIIGKGEGDARKVATSTLSPFFPLKLRSRISVKKGAGYKTQRHSVVSAHMSCGSERQEELWQLK